MIADRSAVANDNLNVSMNIVQLKYGVSYIGFMDEIDFLKNDSKICDQIDNLSRLEL